jgi:outer membrane protein TolC
VRLFYMRYKGGTTTYLEVLDGQRSLYSTELTLAQARGNEYQSLVQLFRSLGGGWQQKLGPSCASIWIVHSRHDGFKQPL